MIYVSEFDVMGNHLLLAATEQGVCYMNNHKRDTLMKYLQKYGDAEIVTGKDADAFNKQYIEDMKAYFNGELSDFNWSFDLRGTAFQQSVWDALLTLPYGTTTTYGSIAQMIGKPTAVRAVGGAVGKNPVMIAVPCHRVIGQNGKLTGFSSGIEVKRQLLDIEEIPYHD